MERKRVKNKTKKRIEGNLLEKKLADGWEEMKESSRGGRKT